MKGRTRSAVWVAMALAILLITGVARAAGFTFTFAWGSIPLCTTGSPNVVPNPEFHLSGVPRETRVILFQLTDLAVPDYHHGGGRAVWHGEDTISPGVFTYRSPCPPNGVHTYEWHATALDAAGRPLATAIARKPYP